MRWVALLHNHFAGRRKHTVSQGGIRLAGSPNRRAGAHTRRRGSARVHPKRTDCRLASCAVCPSAPNIRKSLAEPSTEKWFT